MAYTTINDPSKYYQSILWTGNDGTQTINTTGNSNLDPDIVWTFSRTDAANNKCCFDSSRGNQYIRTLQANETEAYSTGFAFDFPAGGDGIDLDGNWGHINANNETYRGHLWKVNGGTTSSNTDGDLTVTTQVNQTAGVSICTWTAPNATARNIGHGLGSEPDDIAIFARNRSEDWRNYWKAKGPGGLSYNEEYPYNTSTTALITGATSTTFGVGTDFSVNGAYNYCAYCFKEVQGYSRFGSYKGNGISDSPFIYTGFKPALVIIKSIETGVSWFLVNNSNDPDNVVSTRQKLNDTSAETSANTTVCDFYSNGFKIQLSSGYYGDSSFNTSGNIYMYQAFAEHPFVTSTGTPVTAR